MAVDDHDDEHSRNEARANTNIAMVKNVSKFETVIKTNKNSNNVLINGLKINTTAQVSG